MKNQGEGWSNSYIIPSHSPHSNTGRKGRLFKVKMHIFFISATASAAVIFVSVLFISSYLWYKTTNFTRLMNKLPGPSPKIVANALKKISRVEDCLRLLSIDWASKYGEIYRANIGGKDAVITPSPDIIQTVLSSSKVSDYGLTNYYLHPWKQSIGVLNHAESKRNFAAPAGDLSNQDVIDICHENVSILSEEIHKFIGITDVVVDIESLIYQCAFDIVYEVVTGRIINGQPDTAEYIAAFHRLFSIWTERYSDFLLWSEIRSTKANVDDELAQCGQILDRHTSNIIRDRREIPNRPPVRRSVLDDLLDASSGEEMCNRDLREGLLTLTFEGTRSLDTAIHQLLHCLAVNQDCQKKAHKEVDAVFGQTDHPCIETDIHQLNYLECCIKESLRLHPSVPFFTKNVRENLRLGQYQIPAGCDVLMLNYACRQSPAFRINPNTFWPERFSSEEAVHKTSLDYITFYPDLGNNNGLQWIMTSAKAVVSKLLRQYEFQLIPNCEDTLSGLIASVRC